MTPYRHVDEWLTLLRNCSDAADDISKHYFHSPTLKVDQKSNNTPVTIADQEAEMKIRDIAAAFDSRIQILGEEHGQCPLDAPLKLIVDPIDGTQNFIRRLPFFASLLGIEEHGEVVAGMVSCPMTGERWWAAKGQGAFYNGKPIKVSSVSSLSECLVMHSSIYGSEAKGAPEGFIPLLSKTKRQRGFGDYYIHVLVAMGCGDFAVDFNLNPWDMAPLKIITEEAGGKMTDMFGKPSIYENTIITSNGILHDEIIRELHAKSLPK